MPTYEYKCTRCEKIFEVFHSINGHPDIHCPACSGPAERIISAGAGIIVKGADHTSPVNSITRCGSHSPCCGRDTPCATPPCDT
jgi:putative FmdB family regulatory protein